MQFVLSSGFLNVSIFPLTLLIFIGYPLILVSSTNLHVFATTVCLLTIRPTYLTFLPFTPLPVSFAQVLTTLSSVVHMSVQYPMVKGLSHTPPLLLGTLFLSRSALLIMCPHKSARGSLMSLCIFFAYRTRWQGLSHSRIGDVYCTSRGVG